MRHGHARHQNAVAGRDSQGFGRRNSEFIRFLNAVERAVPAGKLVHGIVDNYATHTHPRVMKWRARHPRWTFHFTPTSASWLNAVEGFFSTITRRKIRRGVFKSVADLKDSIARYIEAHNKAMHASAAGAHERAVPPLAAWSFAVAPMSSALAILFLRYRSRPAAQMDLH